DPRQRPTRRPGTSQHALRRDDDVDVKIVRSGGHRAARKKLPVVHCRDDDGLGIDEACFRGDCELEIAEATALAEARARLVDAHASRDHEIDWFELVDADRARAACGALDRARSTWIVCEARGIEEDERIVL